MAMSGAVSFASVWGVSSRVQTAAPTHDGRTLPSMTGMSASAMCQRSRMSQRMPYALATRPTVSIGSLTVTTPPRPVKYLNPDVSTSMSSSVWPTWSGPSRAIAACCRSWRSVFHSSWTFHAPRAPVTNAMPTVALRKNRVASASFHFGPPGGDPDDAGRHALEDEDVGVRG